MPKQSARLTGLLSIICVAWFAMPQGKPSHSTAGQNPDSAAQGKQAFVANCGVCHGLDGSGGERAPSIAAGSDASRLNDADLRGILANGIAGAGMPPFSSLGNAGIRSIVSYLRVLQGKGSSEQIAGDPQRGSAVFFGKARCADCHMANGKGGFLAADLTAYGQGRTPTEIRAAIVAPGQDVDRNVQQATVVTRSGEKYSGIVRTEDNFSLVLLTLRGEFVRLQKSDVESLSYNADPLMPKDYATTLTADELTDVISYLMHLQPKLDPSAAQRGAKRHWDDED